MEGCDLNDTWLPLYQRDPILLVCLNDHTIQKLDLSSCGLTEAPPALTGLLKLADLSLAHNALTSLPCFMTTLTALTSLDVAGNPLQPPLLAMLAEVCAWHLQKAHRAGD